METKEYEAHQLRRLGSLQEASRAYHELELLAQQTLPAGRERDMTCARAKRWLASLIQAHACEQFRQGLKAAPGSMKANQLMTGQHNQADGDNADQINTPGALPLRAPHGKPFLDWDAIEQGDMLYLSAFIYKQLGFGKREQRQLQDAHTSYKAVLSQTPARRWFVGGTTRQLRSAAASGLCRVEEAQKNSTYDVAWLLPVKPA